MKKSKRDLKSYLNLSEINRMNKGESKGRIKKNFYFLLLPIVTTLLIIGIFQIINKNLDIMIDYVNEENNEISDNVNTILGPTGGTVTSIAIDPLNNETLFVGTWGNGLFMSYDKGKRWVQKNNEFDNGFIYDIAINTKDSSHMLVSIYKAGVYLSNDGGITWIKSSGLPENSVIYALRMDPYDQNIVYAAVRIAVENFSGHPYPGGVFRSDNGGKTWMNMSKGLPVDYVYDLAIDPIDTNRIFAATHEFGIFSSVNKGEEWFSINYNVHSLEARSVLINPDTSNLYAGFWRRAGIAFFDAVSKTWYPIWSTLESNLDVYRIYLDPIKPESFLYLATRNGLYRCNLQHSILKPTTCESLGLKNEFVIDIAFDNESSKINGAANIIYAATQHKGLYVSEDGGHIFTKINNGIKANTIMSILNDPEEPDLLYVSVYERGVYKSEDEGQTWFRLLNGLPQDNITQLVFRPGDTNVIYAASQNSGLFISENKGRSWRNLNRGMSQLFCIDNDELINEPIWPDCFSGKYPGMTMIEIHPTKPNIVTVGTNRFGLIKSYDYGESWESTSINYGEVNYILGVKSHNTDAFVIGFSDLHLKTYDIDDDFVRVTNQGIHDGLEVYALSKITIGEYLAGTDNGVYKTYNSGKTWIPIGLSSTSITNILVDIKHTTAIWVAGSNGLYKSDNGGYDWDKVRINNINKDIVTLGQGYGRCELYLGLNGGNIFCLNR